MHASSVTCFDTLVSAPNGAILGGRLCRTLVANAIPLIAAYITNVIHVVADQDRSACLPVTLLCSSYDMAMQRCASK
jgi:hypothetical protein